MPSKYQGDQEQKKLLGTSNRLLQRPSPLMNIHSKPIKKHQKGPVIIYTLSPKIIHTKPNDFMALVQRLTGRDQLVNCTRDITGSSMAMDEELSTGVDLSTEEDSDIPVFSTPTLDLNSGMQFHSNSHNLHRSYGDFMLESSPSMYNVKSEFIQIMK